MELLTDRTKMEIKPEDLRIGNIVKHFEIGEIRTVGKSCAFKLPTRTIRVDVKDLEGVPITEDILLRLGFEYSGEGFYRNGAFSIEYDSDITANDTIDLWFGNKYIKELEYLHQLQNIYHSLTNQELKLN